MKKRIVTQVIMLLFVFNVSNSSLHEENKALKYYRGYLEKIAENEEQERREKIISAIMEVESNYDSTAFNFIERAAGILQTRPIMVREVNRLMGYKKYSMKDRWEIVKSVELFKDYQNKLNPLWDAETAARLWNGGMRGMKKKSTIKYWEKVKKVLDRKEKELNL